jgi:hypothetical protein
MPNYHEIKEKELETTKDYSDKKLRRYIKLHKILLSLYSKLFFWIISFIPMMLFPILAGEIDLLLLFLFAHFLFWYFKGDKMYHKECDKDIEDLRLTIEVLEDIQKDR